MTDQDQGIDFAEWRKEYHDLFVEAHPAYTVRVLRRARITIPQTHPYLFVSVEFPQHSFMPNNVLNLEDLVAFQTSIDRVIDALKTNNW